MSGQGKTLSDIIKEKEQEYNQMIMKYQEYVKDKHNRNEELIKFYHISLDEKYKELNKLKEKSNN